MTFFDAHVLGLLVTLAIASAMLVIAARRVAVVRVVRAVRVVVPRAPSRAGRR